MSDGGLSLRDLPPAPEGREGWPWTVATPERADASVRRWPRITVVTPSYNQGEYLEETIRSVLLQGYPDLEYIVVDGGSTDESVEIIQRYQAHLAWWVSEKDRGQTHAINKGFERATGEIFAYLNSDDVYEPGALFAAAEVFLAGAEWVVGEVSCFSEDGGSWPFPQLPGRSFTRWFLGCPISQPGVFWSARLHRDTGPFREDLRYVMDYEYWLRLRFVVGASPRLIRCPFARYRMHPESKSVAQQEGMGREVADTVRAYQRRLGRLQRGRLWLARRHRRGRVHGARAVALLRDGDPRSALLEFARALRHWPLLVVDPGAFVGIARRLRGPPQPSGFPDSWPDPDDEARE